MDDTYGWIGVPDKPTAPEGKEVVWWYPPGWVIRDPKPADEEGYKWSWSQSTEEWVKYALSNDTSDQVDSPALEQSEVLVIVDTPAPSTAGSEPPASE